MSTINPLKRKRETEINGNRVTIMVLGSLAGITLARKLAQTFLPAYSAMLAQDGKGFGLMEGFEIAVEKLGEIEVNKIIAQLFDQATVNDMPLSVDDYFAANYGELVDFLKFAIVENFGSFFKAEAAKSLTVGE